MRTHYSKQALKEVMFICMFLMSCALVSAFPTFDEDRVLEREFMTPGVHQFPSWLTYQLSRNNDMPQKSQDNYRFPISQGKRNSELTNSMMGIPRNMIDNGKK